MDGFQLSKAAEPLQGGTLIFTTKLTSILSFPKSCCQIAANYFSIRTH